LFGPRLHKKFDFEGERHISPQNVTKHRINKPRIGHFFGVLNKHGIGLWVSFNKHGIGLWVSFNKQGIGYFEKVNF